MIRVWIVFILLVAAVVWGIVFLLRRKKNKSTVSASARFAAKVSPESVWAQLFETDSWDEIMVLRSQLQDEKLDYLVYEQGKRDSYGNIPKKYGVVMSKGHLSRGQSILARVLS